MIGATKRFIVYPGNERFSIAKDVTAISLIEMMKELENDKSLGYLGGESWFGRNIISVQYWESFEHLENFAKSRDHSHLPAWQKFLKNVGVKGDVGIWHETYEIKKGSYENIYANMPPFLLGKVANLNKVTSSNNSARKRKS